jgi:hypothetical protein
MSYSSDFGIQVQVCLHNAMATSLRDSYEALFHIYSISDYEGDNG